jgi:hypothetical protein
MPSRPDSALPRLRARLVHWGSALARLRAWIVVSGIAVAMVMALTGVAAAGGFEQSASRTGTRTGTQPGGMDRSGSTTPAPAPGKARSRAGGQQGQAGGQHRPAAAGGSRVLRTSCRTAAHIGDSVSADLISPEILPDPAQRLAARYADVGVKHLRVDASGGRSVVEALPGQVNGFDVAQAWWRGGYRGCWVFALGTNDTADMAVGSAVGLMARIERMMSAAHGEPVLWVNTRTELPAGPWSEASERLWDDTLLRALARYPNMRIFDWSAVAQPGWFLPDGIHYNSAGCAARAKAIADALARAFPAGGHSTARVVR